MEQLKTPKHRGRPLPPGRVFPNRLREFRLRAGHTQASLAELIGVSPQTIATGELYGRSIGKDSWYKLADIFGVDPRVLEGKKNSPTGE